MVEIGWSKRDISTDKPVVITGQSYIRYSKGVMDPIMATALTVGDEKDYAIFVSLDITNIRKDVLLSVRQRVAQLNSEIDPEKIILNATHTHAAPLVEKIDEVKGKIRKFSENFGKSADVADEEVELTSPREYFEFFVEQVSQAICESFNKRKEGYISYGYGYAVSSHNRRVVYFKDMTEGSDDKRFRLTEGWA